MRKIVVVVTVLAALVAVAGGAATTEKSFVPSHTIATWVHSCGSQYFDATRAAAYSINKASFLFNLAAKFQFDLPGVHHNLARISFLKGDFQKALDEINLELSLNPEPSPSSYYVRGLIKGYMDDFDGAAEDFELFLLFDPHSWAGMNDYAWVLIKAGRADDAVDAIEKVLFLHPENSWLLNTYATALFESGHTNEAREAVTRAARAAMELTEQEWSRANPGNDPLIAVDGVAAFQSAVLRNMHTIVLASTNEGEDMR